MHLAGLASVRDFVPVLGLILLWPIRPADENYNVSGAFNKQASLRAVVEKASLQILHLCSVSRKPDDHLDLFRDHVLNGVTKLIGAKHTLRANVACRAHSA